MVRVAIDFENQSKRWWNSGGRDLWEGVREGFDSGAVLLDDAIAESVLAAAARIDGWNDGPDYAPHPLRVVPVDEDEDL